MLNHACTNHTDHHPGIIVLNDRTLSTISRDITHARITWSSESDQSDFATLVRRCMRLEPEAIYAISS